MNPNAAKTQEALRWTDEHKCSYTLTAAEAFL
jgi:hypothetical protein